jgi:cystathionine gamma-synthase
MTSQHQLARRQLSGGFGGVVSFQVRGERESAMAVCANVKVFTHATSLGETEALIQHRASSPTHGLYTGMAENLLSLSVSRELTEDLIADIVEAIEAGQAGIGVCA